MEVGRARRKGGAHYSKRSSSAIRRGSSLVTITAPVAARVPQPNALHAAQHFALGPIANQQHALERIIGSGSPSSEAGRVGRLGLHEVKSIRSTGDPQTVDSGASSPNSAKTSYSTPIMAKKILRGALRAVVRGQILEQEAMGIHSRDCSADHHHCRRRSCGGHQGPESEFLPGLHQAELYSEGHM